LETVFTKFANTIAHWVGKPVVFASAVFAIVVWAISGSMFSFSETWQLVVNTGTTIITFLMVFILQNTQNRDNETIQAKLDELILTSTNAENRFIGLEKKAEGKIGEAVTELERAARC
jgi:low affinity Fe/Cu permease